jgi:hypothetical protein
MSKEFFSDGFANIAVTGTVVRIDLMSMVGVNPDGKPRMEVKSRMVMPLDAFLRSYAMSEDIVNKLIKAGVVNKRTPPEPGPTIQASSEASTKKK